MCMFEQMLLEKWGSKETPAHRQKTGLADQVRDPTPLARLEGKRHGGTTRERSSMLQAIALSGARGQCQACDRSFRAVFAGAGVAGLEVHHLDHLGAAADETVKTASDRLAVVCAGCHRILHSARQPSLRELQAEWRRLDDADEG